MSNVKAGQMAEITAGPNKGDLGISGVCQDKYLRPILPPEEPETVTRDEEVTA